MNAIEFVRAAGWEEAKGILAAESFTYRQLGLFSYVHHDLENLKRIVESHELVERLGGLNEAAAKFIKYQHQEPCFREYLKCSSRRLEQAITDVEACQ
ncbi:hypothetical protein EC844_12559 [Acinetobacter calcoaceticus]|uniref:Uncharacterized protein n=1 Tax=Acinetobacter calcoaceticus TaxID=471 RepID=A0A4R1XHE4_ACICA|nr:hypothetical protein EC844_12559 [Acinetobacter calcoaceticus]